MPSPDAIQPTILIVDDTPENLDILKSVLAADYNVRLATNGTVALRVARMAPLPDLVLLDIMMPGIDGYEVCRRLKTDPLTRDIPVLFITAKCEEVDELQGLADGAVDYITKPISIPIVRARVKTHIELHSTKKQLCQYNERLLHERQMIESIILKMRRTDLFEDRNLRFIVAPVEQTAGDMLLATFAPDGRQLVLLGDFTGHGLPAAIGGPLVTHLFYDQARRGRSGAAILQDINGQLYRQLPTGFFFAAALFEIAADRSQALLWNAGLPDCLLVRAGAPTQQLPSLLPPLGILNAFDPVGGAGLLLSLLPGDRCYAFSDGVVEAASNQGLMFGIDRLQAFLEQPSSSQQPLGLLVQLLTDHTGTTDFADDITLVEITV
ncbi:MAG: SpoIIE family protein phosphatase [Magnetococcales bacterium]|nr:SpoIIE family protein phosphatase [Magnetococcales bacterium]